MSCLHCNCNHSTNVSVQGRIIMSMVILVSWYNLHFLLHAFLSGILWFLSCAAVCYVAYLYILVTIFLWSFSVIVAISHKLSIFCERKQIVRDETRYVWPQVWDMYDHQVWSLQHLALDMKGAKCYMHAILCKHVMLLIMLFLCRKRTCTIQWC